ncbi:hypothetical protein THAOC_37460, partial [Thalassiosira oceanica]
DLGKAYIGEIKHANRMLLPLSIGRTLPARSSATSPSANHQPPSTPHPPTPCPLSPPWRRHHRRLHRQETPQVMQEPSLVTPAHGTHPTRILPPEIQIRTELSPQRHLPSCSATPSNALSLSLSATRRPADPPGRTAAHWTPHGPNPHPSQDPGVPPPLAGLALRD